MNQEIAELRRNVAAQGAGILELAQAVEKLNDSLDGFREDMKPILEIYNGGKFARSLLIGIASFVGSLVALGASVWAIIRWLKNF